MICKLLQKYKAIRTKAEELKNIELSALPVYNAHITTKKISRLKCAKR